MDDLLNTAPCGFFSFSDDGIILRANTTLNRYLEYGEENIQGLHIHTILPVASRLLFQTHLLPLLNISGSADEIYFTLLSKSKTKIPILANAIRQNRNNQISYEFALMTISRRNEYENQILQLKEHAENNFQQIKQLNGQLQKLLDEKEVLLKEVYHRVKNNLQVISSLINLQARSVSDHTTKDLLKQSSDRIKSMAILHENLYRSNDLANIDINVYVQGLVDNLMFSYGANRQKINVKLDIDDLSLDVDTAIPCGLIINELVSNSLKYAFPNDQDGAIDIQITCQTDQLKLVVKDNGIGIPPSLDLKKSGSLGLKLVNILAAQLSANIDMNNTGGTSFCLNIPKHFTSNHEESAS